MPTKFIFDRIKKQEDEIIAQILDTVKKEPYPDVNTTILASFIHSMFQVQQKHKQNKVELKQKPVHTRVLKPLPEPPKFHPEELPEPPKLQNEELPEPPPTETLLPPPPVIGKTNTTQRQMSKDTLLPPPPAVQQKPLQEMSYAITTFNTNVNVKLEKDSSNNVVYKLNEPIVKPELVKLVKEYIKNDFVKDFKILDNVEFITKKTKKACKKLNIEFSDELLKNLIYYLKRDLLGFRRIDPLIYDNNVKAIYCDGLNKPVVVDYKDGGKIKTNIVFSETVDLNSLIKKLAKATGNEISEDKPVLDTLYQGYRIQAIWGMGGASSKLIIKKE